LSTILVSDRIHLSELKLGLIFSPAPLVYAVIDFLSLIKRVAGVTEMIKANRFLRDFFWVILLFVFLPSPSHSQKSPLEEAKALNRKVIELYRQGQYLEAIGIAKRVLSLFEKTLGPEHPNVATGLNTLARLHKSLGDYAKAEPLYQQSLTIREKAFGPDHPKVAMALNDLAVLYYHVGDYAGVEPLYQRSLAIWEKTLGPEHPRVATSLNNLALLYMSLGNYAKAEPLYKRSLTIYEKALGPDHPKVATSLNNLAALYRYLGDYPRAEPLYKRSLTIEEKTLGPDHPDVALDLNNLADLYMFLRDYPRAEPLYKRSLAIYEKAFGPDHSDVALVLNNLAAFYSTLGDYPRAEPLYKRSLAIYEKALGPDHPRVATSLNNLALLYMSLGNYAKAEPLYKRSLTIKEKALGPDHPKVATSLNNLALLFAAQGEFSKAHSQLMHSQAIDEKIIDQVMGFTSEDRQTIFLATRAHFLEMALSLVAMHLKEDPSVRKDALDMWLRRKGVVLETHRKFQEALVYSDDPKAVSTFQDLARIRSQLSQLTFGGPGKQGAKVYQKKMAELETRKRELGARLSTLSRAYALKKKIERADSTKVAQALPVNTALLEFVRIKTYNFNAKGKERKWLPARYLAFAVHAGQGDRVEMVDLGDAGEIDRTVALFKKELGESMDRQALQAMDRSRRIHDLVFAPLKRALGGVKEVFISPDGNLNLIPFEVLRGPDGRFLIEEYTFNYLAAGRDILGFGEIKEKGTNALLMGDPDFDLGAEEKGATLRKLALSKEKPLDTTKPSQEMRGFSFQKLPGTREEVEGIQTLLRKEKADTYTGKEALEDVLRQKGAPRILHLATHGFFLRDIELEHLAPESWDRGIHLSEGPEAAVKKNKIENPLLRSGIALAGANNALRSGSTQKSDGIVTAEKILGLRLRGTDMVVLSACDTGLGEVKAGEGVYGLRRAFSQAGTRSLVMSMWSVPDKETKELMIQFYKNLLSGKMNRCQALRQAALKEIRIVKKRYGYPHPFFWGAFVFMGEP
jgi:CHAT domain-containing protein/Tfp pilus assembly protein PilF